MDTSFKKKLKYSGPLDVHIHHLSRYLYDEHTIRLMELRLSHKRFPLRTPPLPLNRRTCFIILCHAIEFLSSSEDREMRNTIVLLSDVCQLCTHDLAFSTNAQTLARLKTLSGVLVNSFRPQVLKFFTVPTQNQSSFQANEILARFLDFLLQILDSESGACTDDDRKQLLEVLQKELTYIFSYLGDKPFQPVEVQEVQNILAEFEVLANHAGSFIYSFVFCPQQIEADNFNDGIDALLKQIRRFNSRIKEHCVNSSELSANRASVMGSSFIIYSLVEDLENLMNRLHFKLDVKYIVKHKIERLQDELMLSRSLIKDVKVCQGANKDELEEPLAAFRDAAYEAEYLIKSYVLENIPTWYLNIRLFALLKKIRQTRKRLPKIKDNCQRRTLLLSKVSSKYYLRSPTSFVDKFAIGFEENRVKILGDLVGGSKSLRVVSISGMPGVGKTTFTSHLFNDPAISDHFSHRSWCVVSETYDKRKALIDILMDLASTLKKDEISEKETENLEMENILKTEMESLDMGDLLTMEKECSDMEKILKMEEGSLDDDKILKMDTQSLVLNIYRYLKGRRYLIVMDDIWYSSIWYDVKTIFPDDENGSRVVFTSRDKDTAPGGTIFHEIPLLSKDQCWSLLEKKVFLNKSCPRELQGIGKKIAKKCHGLPLAVVTIGGILADMERKQSAWKKLERNLDSHISAGGSSDYVKILELSYKHLPDHLKPCFLYLGVFSKGEEIAVREIIWRWIAQGFIAREGKKSLEQVAEEYLVVLINRSLLVIASSRADGGIRTCRIHDLLHDMCLRKGHQENFLKFTDNHLSICQNHSHLRVHPRTSIYWRPLGLHCRSLIAYHASKMAPCFKRMPLLRAASLRIDRWSHTFSPDDISINLRYLGVNRLPSRLNEFVNLEFLCVRGIGTFNLYFIRTMLKLSHLDVKSEMEFGDDLCGLDTRLEYISYVSINNSAGSDVVKCSPNLRKLKCKCDETLFPALCYLNELESLRMDFGSRVKGDFSQIKFPYTVKKLCLSGIGLPWEEMSLVGRLPNLQVLKLENDAFVGEKWEARDGEFQGLRFLKIEKHKIQHWTTWSEYFPKLRHLVLRWCWELQEVPSELGHISTLQKLDVRGCGKEATLSALQIEKEQQEYENDELEIIVDSYYRQKEEPVLESSSDSDIEGLIEETEV